jgi:hypothetical protein
MTMRGAELTESAESLTRGRPRGAAALSQSEPGL